MNLLLRYGDLIDWANAEPWRVLLFYAVAFTWFFIILTVGARGAQWWMDYNDRRREYRALRRRH